MQRKSTEATEQQRIVQYCDTNGITMFAIPNGGKRDAKEAYFLKLSGVKAGVPDMFFAAARHGWHGLFIELKVGKNKLTKSQEKWLGDLRRLGYAAVMCVGYDEAIKIINWYYGGDFN